MTYYAVFFTRQDMIPEQQIVQTAHAAYKLGMAQGLEQQEMMKRNVKDGYIPYVTTPNPDETHFTVIGVRNLEALNAVEEILKKFGYKYEVFNEPDIGGENTSIAVYPIDSKDRGPLLAFNLLKVK